MTPDLNSLPAADAARAWAAAGFYPLALHGLDGTGACSCGRPERHPGGRGAGKHPVARDWQATALDLKDLERELRRGPRNVGLRTGIQQDGRWLIAIDIDGEEGLASMTELVVAHGTLPDTLMQRTGGGGVHLLFEWGSDPFTVWRAKSAGIGARALRGELARRCPTTSASKLANKVDIRGRGGQVVAAPSLHHSGSRYRLLAAGESVVLPAPRGATGEPIGRGEPYHYSLFAGDRVAPIPDRWLRAILETH